MHQTKLLSNPGLSTLVGLNTRICTHWLHLLLPRCLPDDQSQVLPEQSVFICCHLLNWAALDPLLLAQGSILSCCPASSPVVTSSPAGALSSSPLLLIFLELCCLYMATGPALLAFFLNVTGALAPCNSPLSQGEQPVEPSLGNFSLLFFQSCLYFHPESLSGLSYCHIMLL